MTRNAKSTPGASASATSAPGTGKLQTLIALLKRPQGASLEEMQAVTGWQPHSVRGAMSGAIRKKRGFAIASEKTDAGRVYRIVEGAGA